MAEGDHETFISPATGLSLSFASLASLLAAAIEKDLGDAGVERLVGGDARDHLDLCPTMERG